MFATRAADRQRKDKLVIARRHRAALSRLSDEEAEMPATATITCGNCHNKAEWVPGTTLRCSKCGTQMRTAQPRVAVSGPRISTR